MLRILRYLERIACALERIANCVEAEGQRSIDMADNFKKGVSAQQQVASAVFSSMKERGCSQ